MFLWHDEISIWRTDVFNEIRIMDLQWIWGEYISRWGPIHIHEYNGKLHLIVNMSFVEISFNSRVKW